MSSPRAFKDSLTAISHSIKDNDFVSMHDNSKKKDKDDTPTSGSWGMVQICVGIASKDGVVAVRNTNDPDKTTTLFTKEEWRVFVDGVKSGHFDNI